MSSEPGKGSCFRLVLPESPVLPAGPPPLPVPTVAVSAPRAQASVPASAADTRTGGIFIIEYDPAFAAVLAGIARSRTSRVEVAHTGEQGLELARSMKPDGVLLDVGLPGISGWEVMQQLRATEGLEETPVHFISGDDVGARAQAVGAASYLRKPVSREQVMRILDQLPGRLARRILLVEDNLVHRAQIRNLLKDESAELDECATGEEALARMASQTYDLLIMDIGLPGMDGFEFLEAASARGPLPPVVVHSSRDLTREESLKLREYTDSILVKGNVPPRRLLDEATLFLHSLRKSPAAPAAVAAPEVPAELNGRTMLVVDDDMRNIFALSKALRSRGMKVMMAQDGLKALAQLEASPEIQLVLMDIMMPGMDGYEVMNRIRQQARWARLPIIAVTAKAMPGDREKCLKAGANDYCAKPIDMDQLTAQICQLLVS